MTKKKTTEESYRTVTYYVRVKIHTGETEPLRAVHAAAEDFRDVLNEVSAIADAELVGIEVDSNDMVQSGVSQVEGDRAFPW